jgi:hypothetical protein
MRRLALSFVPLVFACQGGPPAKTASGELIDRVVIEEEFALSDKVNKTTLRGDQLRTALELMDKHGISKLEGKFESKSVVAKGTVTIIVKPTSGVERRIVVNSCVHESVCPFFEAAVAQKLLDRQPVACKSEAPCGS